MGKLPEIQKAEEAVVLLLRKRDAEQDVCSGIARHDASVGTASSLQTAVSGCSC